MSLRETRFPDLEWEQALVERFNQARDEEYAEVVEGVERFEDEIRRKTRKQKFTFAELEDIEADWDKLQRWHERVRTRDFFASGAGETAAQALERGQLALERFTAKVYAREGMQSDATGGSHEPSQ